MVNKELDNYEPFGDEWKKEVSKLPKAMLIEQWKKSRLEVKELERENAELRQRIAEIVYLSEQPGGYHP